MASTRVWSMPEDVLEDLESSLDPSPPPPLICGDREDEEPVRDGGRGFLVIGRRLPLPGHKAWRCQPQQWQGDWDLRRVVAEVAAQHPDYGGLQAAVREELWDIDYTEHPNTSSRMDLRRFDVRMSTYSGGGWHQSLVSPEELARAGLYYVGMEDRVCCFSCGIQLEEWGEKDPLTRHCLASPHCAFLQQDFPEQLESLRQSPGPQQTQFSNTSHRLHSFANWPLSSVVTSYQLASVGFYYTGEGATVVCFSCGLEVREWQKGDVPLLVHCRSNPECPFIKSIIKGGGPSSEKKQAPTPMMQTLAIDSTSRPDYSDLQVRLQSFKKLSPAFPIPRLQLAEAGLFLLRLPDVMKCHSCGVVLQGWVRGDTAVEKHHGASPHCQFLENRFPCKLTSPSVVDPSSLPAAEFNESELEMMAQQQPSSTSYQQNCPFPSSGSTHESLSLTGLSISDTHTLTASNTTSFIPPASNSLSGLGTSSQAVSGTQELSYSSTAHASTSTTHSASAAQLTPATKLLGGNPVSLPPSHLQALSHSHTTAPEKSTSLMAGAECVVCMDRPLEMVFVPCGHICVCEECSSQITRCPICRSRTQMAVKVYYPY